MNMSDCLEKAPSLFQASSSPFGISFPEWTARWWRWLLRIPSKICPAVDTTGHFCSQSQDDLNVWFLAGTLGGFATRCCIIPSRRGILFPVINYEASFADEPLLKTKFELEERCREEMDKIADLSLSVDGCPVEIGDYRVSSPAFEIKIERDNCLHVRPGLTSLASDGYWLFLRPLEKGKHSIESFSSCLAGKIKIGCTYQLEIQ
jgi:hypothetical protein